jgi:5-deoxy-D-glucuronate isomerase
MQHESVVRARSLDSDQAGELVAFTREQAGWEWMSFVVTRLLPGQTLELRTGNEEMVLSCWEDAVSLIGAQALNRSGKERMFSTAFLLPFTCLATVKSR